MGLFDAFPKLRLKEGIFPAEVLVQILVERIRFE
jgi:hypothetical protein